LTKAKRGLSRTKLTPPMPDVLDEMAQRSLAQPQYSFIDICVAKVTLPCQLLTVIGYP